jgi:hypothetical protein
MAIIPYPSAAFHELVELRQMVSVQANRSELSGARQAIDLGYAWWEAYVVLGPMDGMCERAMRVFIGRMRGALHSFRLPILEEDQHSGTYTVRAQGAGSGYSLITDGWPANSTPLLAGQYVTVGDQLMLLDQDVTANAVGGATLQFHSPLRRVVADNTVVETKAPWLLCYFPEGAPGLSRTFGLSQDGFSFSVVEAY